MYAFFLSYQNMHQNSDYLHKKNLEPFNVDNKHATTFQVKKGKALCWIIKITLSPLEYSPKIYFI